MKLQQALSINAVFSVCSALIMLLFSQWLSKHIPLPASLWLILTIGLIGFSLIIVLIAVCNQRAKKFAQGVIAADVIWVASTTAAVLIFYSSVSVTGLVLIMLVNLIVIYLIIKQRASLAVVQK